MQSLPRATRHMSETQISRSSILTRSCLSPRRSQTFISVRSLVSRPSAMSTLSASFYRGGTSNGLMILKDNLPQDRSEWPGIMSPAMGSPDPYSRQLNGMGGGISSLSKICVVSKSMRDDADVDYTFVQVGIEDEVLDINGNCGNMSSAVAPFALDEGLVTKETIERGLCGDGKFLIVRIFNVETSKVIHSKIAVKKHGDTYRYNAHGDLEISGVSGTASPIALSFINPAGSKTGKALPTGNAVDQLSLSDGTTISASLTDVSNPGVFIKASDVGVTLPCDGSKLNDDKSLMNKLEEIRSRGATRMGLDSQVKSIPKIVMLSSPEEDGVNIRALALSMGVCHKAIPLTLALNLGVSCEIEGTIPNQLRRTPKETNSLDENSKSVTIAHPSGTLDVKAEFEKGEVKSAVLMRTARLLMKGEVNCD